MIDFTVNLGNILTVIAFLIGGIGFASTIKTKVESISGRLDTFEKELRKLIDVLVILGRQDERLNALDRRVESILKRTNRFFTSESNEK